MSNLQEARKFLIEEQLPVGKVFFNGVPIEEFDKDDLIRLVKFERMEYINLEESHATSLRMAKLFSEM